MKIFTQILTAISAGVFANGAAAAPIQVGTAIPAVAQKNQNGETVKLSEIGASGYLLVYFYPKADTPGCTKQACSLRDSYAALSDKGVKIYGASLDSIKSQKAFHAKYKLPFDLLADTEGTLVDAFGVPKTLGFSKRQAFLFHNGKLVWSDLSASTEQQAADVLNFLAKP